MTSLPKTRLIEPLESSGPTVSGAEAANAPRVDTDGTGDTVAPMALDTAVAIATLDAAGRPLAANAAFTALFGSLATGVSLAEPALRRFGESALPLPTLLAHGEAFTLALRAATESGAAVLRGSALDGGDRRLVVVEGDAMPVAGRAGEVDAPAPTLARDGACAPATADTHLDPLTGLGNRRALDDALAGLVGSAGGGVAASAAVLLMDLDRFKQVNDTLGHGTGDRLLELVARRLRRATRESDTLIRLGGDEFVVLQRGPDPIGTATITAARLIELIGRPFLVDGQQVNIGASVGCAVLDGRHTSPDELIRHADLALYDVKRAGRGAFRFFEPSLETRAMERRETELALRRALGLRELELVYQAQVIMPEARVSGFEALIRWNHPDRGIVSPADFIPLAEEIGEIHAIGEWVLRSACLEAMNWPEDLSVAVNVSPLQFESERFVASVREALDRSGLPPSRLEIEITEGVLIDNVAGAMAHLEAIRDLGVSIAMDDFGTGYSSLSYLNTFPFSKIKIDQSFVRGEQTPRSRALVDAIISLGDSLGMQTLAEGVETEEQFERLAAGGCQAAQGYLVSRPIAPADIDTFLDTHRVRADSRAEGHTEDRTEGDPS